MGANTIFAFIKDYKCSLLLIFVLLLIALKPIDYAFSIPIVVGVISVFLLYSILVFNRIYLLVVFVFTFLISFDAYFAYAFSSYINMGFFASMVETNPTEAASMLSTAWLPALIIFSLLFFLFYSSAKELQKGKIPFKFLILSFAVSIACIGFIYIKGYERENLKRYARDYPVLVAHNLIYTYTPLFYSNFATAIAYCDDMRRFKGFANSTDRPLPQGVVFNEEAEDLAEKIIIVIGESSYRGHYSLYGYDVPTTPFLDSLSVDADSDFNYYNGVSSSPITRDAMRLIMSFATPDDMNLFLTKKSLINMAKDAGYETIWISNQGHSSLDDTYIGYLTSSTDSTYFVSDTYLSSDDLELLPILEKALVPSQKQFIVIHLAGSHAGYTDRYDETDKDAIQSSNKNYLDYDRTIYHTDRFLKEAYNIINRHDDYLLYYTSDHGEIVGVGHGLKEGKSQFEVPLITINRSSIPIDSIVSGYIDPHTKLLSNITSPYFLAEAMGYNIAENNKKSVIEAGKYIFHSDHTVGLFEDVADFKK